MADTRHSHQRQQHWRDCNPRKPLEQAKSDRERTGRGDERDVGLTDDQSPSENDHDLGDTARRGAGIEFFPLQLYDFANCGGDLVRAIFGSV